MPVSLELLFSPGNQDFTEISASELSATNVPLNTLIGHQSFSIAIPLIARRTQKAHRRTQHCAELPRITPILIPFGVFFFPHQQAYNIYRRQDINCGKSLLADAQGCVCVTDASRICSPACADLSIWPTGEVLHHVFCYPWCC